MNHPRTRSEIHFKFNIETIIEIEIHPNMVSELHFTLNIDKIVQIKYCRDILNELTVSKPEVPLVNT